MKNTIHFNYKEFLCRCGCGKGKKEMKQKLINRLEKFRIIIDKPIIITSGFRCKEYNTKIKGAKYSPHMNGTACDIIVKNILIKELYQKVEESKLFERIGISEYKNFLHLDIETLTPYTCLRWYYNEKGKNICTKIKMNG